MNTGIINSSGGGAAGGIATVAQRIRDRAHQLESTRSDLSHLRRTVATTRSAVTTAQTDHATVRSDLLSAVRSRHGVELEVLAVRRRTAAVEVESERLRAQAAETRRSAAAIRERWASVESGLCVPHEVDAATYHMAASDAVRHLDERRAARVRHLQKLATKTAAATEMAEERATESATLRDEMDQMAAREEAEDEDVAALAMQIRATIRKKASLRGATEEARARYAAANDRMLAMERRVVEYSNQSALASKAY